MDTSNPKDFSTPADYHSIDLIHIDDDIVVVNKPAGLLSIPDGYNPALPHVAGCLFSQLGKCWIVHRLDRETSGVMILARSPNSHRDLNLQFEHRQVSKMYHAFILGQPDWEQCQADTALKVNGDRRHRTIAAPVTGKAAQTDFQVIQHFAWGCLLECRPHTGYTHQIRAHLASIGYPILGDELYRNVASNQKPKPDPDIKVPSILRVALHAHTISFQHPGLKTPVSFSAEYPPDLQDLMK